MKKEKKDYTIKFLGNYFNPNYGAGYDGKVFSLRTGLCQTLMASNVPRFLIISKEKSDEHSL